MESGDIKDEQITASASLTGYEPHRARLNEEADGKLKLFYCNVHNLCVHQLLRL